MGQAVVRRLDPVILTSDPASGAGVATAKMPRVPAGQAVLIDRACTSSDSAAASKLDLWVDNPQSVSNRISGSNQGNRDEADFPNGLQVDQTRTLVAVWTGCTPGAVCTLRLQVRDVFGDGT